MRGWIAAAVFGPALAGCMTFDSAIAPDVPIDKVVDHVQCELRDAYDAQKSSHGWLKHWAASFNLTLQKDERLGLEPQLAYRTPTNFGSLTANAKLALSGQTRRSLSVKRSVEFKTFDTPKSIRRYNENLCAQSNSASPILGALGLKQAFKDVLASRQADDEASERPETLTYRVEFTLSYSAEGGPSWILSRFTGLGFDVAAKREMVHTLDFAFSDNRPKPLQHVIVENLPQSSDRSPASAKSRESVRRSAPRSGITPDARFNLDSGLLQLQLQGLQRRLDSPLR